MKIFAVFLVAFGFGVSNAQAADWRLVGQSNTAYAYVDLSSIVKLKATRKAWIMWTDIEEVSKTSGPRSSKVLMHFNCTERSSARAQFTMYAGFEGQGETIASSKYPIVASSFDEVIPDTVGEQIFIFVCGKNL
ncbi:MAG: hypothetical protein Q7T66_04850 [Herminiimonas sp.]|uniref:surface-adhesin E family protein n=1 Tax=Herminiimonas sp. TaxID=1926289 RepID=UPI002718FAFD|nr:surface-adhesin E family protein [Herminiimonas sp.]MDO9419974.1 hypothetical protein [Herminiimonas sp.]